MKTPFLELNNGSLRLVLAEPDGQNGYYRGTRFDWAGVFRKIEMNGRSYADEWFDQYDPYRHDAVCGPSEEFGVIGYEEAAPGEIFLKPGVGWLRRPDDSPYDRFRLYECVRDGERTLMANGTEAVFSQRIQPDFGPWGYEYSKRIRLTGPDTFDIVHQLVCTGEAPLQMSFYNHNFFTLNHLEVGPWREIDFPFRPDGHWREAYQHVRLTDGGIRFSAPMPMNGQSVFMGDLQARSEEGAPLSAQTAFTIRDQVSRLQVEGAGDSVFSFMVFWANRCIACVEPYRDISLDPGATLSWVLRYRLSAL